MNSLLYYHTIHLFIVFYIRLSNRSLHENPCRKVVSIKDLRNAHNNHFTTQLHIVQIIM